MWISAGLHDRSERPSGAGSAGFFHKYNKLWSRDVTVAMDNYDHMKAVKKITELRGRGSVQLVYPESEKKILRRKRLTEDKKVGYC